MRCVEYFIVAALAIACSDRTQDAGRPRETQSANTTPRAQASVAQQSICARIRPCCHSYAVAQFSGSAAQNENARDALERSACEHAPANDERACTQFLEGLAHSAEIHRLQIPTACAPNAMTGHERLRNSTQSARDWANEVRGTLPNDACAACTPPCQNACFLGSPTLIVRAGERTRVRVLVHSAGDAVLRITSNAGDLYVDDAQGLDPVADLDVQSGEYAIYVGRHVESENERADSIDPVRVDVEFVLQTTGDTSATTEHLR